MQKHRNRSLRGNRKVYTILAKNNWNTFPLQHANKQSKSKTTSPKYQCRFKNFDPLPPYNVDLFSQYFHTALSEEIFTFRIKTAELNNIVMGGRGGFFKKSSSFAQVFQQFWQGLSEGNFFNLLSNATFKAVTKVFQG